MGWLSFLSRKSTSNLNNDLKAQAYDETVAANPPIRGTYPVNGNGPSILEKFQKSHPHLRNGQFNDNSAPPPIVPRLLDRPNTAPTQHSPEGSSRSRSQAGAPSKLRELPKKRHGPYKLPSKIPTERNEDSTITRSIHSVPSPTFVRGRNSSIFSGDSESTRGFVDLLDAQSFIKPSDFYGRVKATGTKDYDEDVADRNISENGSNFNSPQAEEFNRKNLPPGIWCDDEGSGRPRSSRKRRTMGYGLQTKSNNSNFRSASPATLALRAYQDEPKNETSLTEKALRRRSLHSYVPSAIERPSSASTGKRLRGQDSDYFPESLREVARAAIWEGFEYDPSVDLSLRDNPMQSSASREISIHRQDSDSDLSCHARNDFSQGRLAPVNQSRSRNNSPQRRTMSHISSTTTKSPSKAGSLRTLHLPYRGDLITESSLPNAEESLSRKKNRSSSKRHREPVSDFDGSFYELTPLQPPEPLSPRTIFGHSNGPDELGRRRGNGSMISGSARSLKRPEIEDVVPERGSSIRRWSLTSETAGSTLSSNPFRPQSGHTTNTSVDLAPRLPSSKAIELDEDNISPESLAGPLLNSGRREPSINLAIDDDTSSIDSFDAPKRSAGEFEKDLLFQGYGFEGSQLPGLPASFDSVKKPRKPKRAQPSETFSVPKDPLHLATLSSTKFEDALSSTFGSQYSTSSLNHKSRSKSSRLQVPRFDYTDSEANDGLEAENDSEDELNFDIPLKRRSEHRYHSYDNIRQYENTAQLFDDDDLDLPDMAVVARLRREARSKQRASSASLRKSRGKGKAPDFRIPRIEFDDHSEYADAES
ncbi:hypothetical protein F5Y11DRAFT_93901 [Daldinia sp. FL1419]|nr:hypothetical protein F5Y11DRAFT_93901 [Daldinia sp. FL1419]